MQPSNDPQQNPSPPELVEGTTSTSSSSTAAEEQPTNKTSIESTSKRVPPIATTSANISFTGSVNSPGGATPTEYKPIETKEWQVDFKKFPIVDHTQVQTAKKYRKKKVSKFYEKQNEEIEGYAELYTNTVTKEFLKDDEESPESDSGLLKQEDQRVVDQAIADQKAQRYETFCIQASFWANVFLLILKVTASFMSLSLSVITSTIDSVLDMVSGLILFYTNMLKKRKNDIYKYPVGKERLEPLGFIIFATCMSTASFQIIKEGVVEIVTGLVTGDVYLPENNQNIIEMFSKPELMHGDMDWMLGIKIPALCKVIFYMYGLGVLFTAIFLKAILYLLCIRAKDSPSCQAYAFDHRNDVLSNTFLIFSLFISNWAWWFDPFGATLLSLYIIYGWIGESAEHVTKLVGLTAESEFIKKLTFIAVNQSEKIMKVETVQAWYSGTNIIAEIHVVLPPDMSLREAHNIGEDLQLKIESVPEVERCFVHLDFNDTHKIN